MSTAHHESQALAAEVNSLAAEIIADTAPSAAPQAARHVHVPTWQALTEAGLADITAPESSGGSGAGFREAAAVLSAAAAAGAPLPLLEHDLLAGWLARETGLEVPNPADRSPLLSCAEVRSSTDIEVPWAPQTTGVVILDTRPAEARAWLLAWPPDEVEPGERHEDIAGVAATTMSPPAAPSASVSVDSELVPEWRLRGALGTAVQMAAAGRQALTLTLEHVRARQQFGRPLAAFQAVQQLVADIASETALVDASVEAALTAVTENGFGDPTAYTRIAVAKATAGRSAETIVRGAHQAHGAIGTTLEHSLQTLTRPLLAWRRAYGSTKEWEDCLEDLVVNADHDLWELIIQ